MASFDPIPPRAPAARSAGSSFAASARDAQFRVDRSDRRHASLDDEAVREIVRELLENEPELVEEALIMLRERRQREAMSQLVGLVAEGETLVEAGATDGDLMLIELTDYNCPYCRRAQPEVAAFLAADP